VAATDQQVQVFVDTQIRPICEAARNLKLQIDGAISQIGDVYAALTEPTPTWTDQRTDAPAHLLSPADVLAINAFLHDISTAIGNDNAYPVVESACVRPVVVS
jgi:hypothetical protein